MAYNSLYESLYDSLYDSLYSSLYEHIVARTETDKDRVILQYKCDGPQNADLLHDFGIPGVKVGEFQSLTGAHTIHLINKIARGLITLGIEPGDRVAIISHTRIEWTLLDYAIGAIGAHTIPVYETNSAPQMEYIFADAGIKHAFVEDLTIFEKISPRILPESHVHVFEQGALSEIMSLADGTPLSLVTARANAIKPDDIATIVYTSGSTGTPKGVILKQSAIMNVALDTATALPEIVLKENAKLLLFLPLAHSFARFCQFAILAPNGHATLSLSSSISTLLDDLQTVKPTVLLGVPRIFEKVYNAASHKASTGALHMITSRIFATAADIAIKYSKALDTEIGPSPGLRAARFTYDQLLYNKIRQVLGGNVTYCVSGGAPLNSEIAHFFRGAGIHVLQGYGMTETVAPMCVNRPDRNKIGTIGLPFPGVFMGQAEDGELILNTPYNFSGYNNQTEATRATLLNDCPKLVKQTGTTENLHSTWIATGDICSIDDDGFVSITGRKKELLVTAGGKNVSPAPLEAAIDSCPIIANSVVIGDNRPFIAALITLDMEEVLAWCKEYKILPLTLSEAISNEAIKAEIQRAINEANLQVSRAESIRKFVILEDTFSEAKGTLTPSMKIRRNNIVKQFANTIEAEIYG